jgi:hypothetical protein
MSTNSITSTESARRIRRILMAGVITPAIMLSGIGVLADSAQAVGYRVL